MEELQTIDKKLEYWKKKLIDLTKRNNLISYRFTQGRSIKIISPGINDILEELNSEESIVFLKNESEERKNHTFLCSEGEKLVDKKLYNLYLKAKGNFQELGINTCFLGLTMLRYKEKSSEQLIEAPIFLYPVEIAKVPSFSNQIHKYEIIPNSGDIQINPALREKLRHEFGILINELGDKSPSEYLQYLKNIISGFEGWAILDDCYLDVFSYQKYIMYEDLSNNEELIKTNQLINAYAGDRNALEQLKVEMNFDEASSVDVLHADSSQKKAIELAKAGATFVLQGPPGTGKSQTIANMISALIGQGKKVLFVSQKMAALNVVQRKLEDLGLGRYCLNLHTYQGKKREIINQLNNELVNPPEISDSVKRFSFNNYLGMQKELNDYYDFLARKHPPWKLSIYDVRGKLAQLHESEMFYSGLDDILELGPEEFDNLLGKIEMINNMLSAKPNVFDSRLFNFKKDKNTALSQGKFKSMLKDLERKRIKTNDFLKIIGKNTNLNINSFEKLRTFLQLQLKINNLKLEKFPEYLISEELENYQSIINELKSSLREFICIKSEIMGQSSEEFLEYDSHHEEEIFQNTSKFARLTSKAYKESRDNLNQFSKTKLNHEGWLSLFSKKYKYSIIDKKLKKLKKENKDFLKLIGSKEIKNLENIEELIKKIMRLVDLAKNLDPNNYFNIVKFMFENEEIFSILDLEELSQEVNGFFEGEVFVIKGEIKNFFEKLDDINSGLNELNEISMFKDNFNSLSPEIRNFILKYSLNENESNLLEVFMKTYYLNILELMTKRENKISPRGLVEKFRKDDGITREMKRFKIMENIEGFKNLEKYPLEIEIVKREIQKKKRLKPIRELLEQAGNLIFALKPCFMMSPLTVSQYINPEKTQFDVVVFDEASQIMPEDAVSCLVRSKQAIIIGDTQQLPPTSFFMNESEEGDERLEDLESFLSEASTRFNEESLNWHYRSENENLIAFSNISFYENRLITFPNPDTKDQSGLEFVYVENGVYDRGASKKNKIEADKVVKEYIKLQEECPEKSMGIVAFSRSQEDAIREAFQENEINLDSEMDSKEEELFIKNLESVQGDERDIIILSIGYGKDKDGRLAYNFGPLNREGGFKRLNVAITRSRFKTIVVSSILPEEMDNRKLHSDGAKKLKQYLHYVKHKNFSDFKENEKLEMDLIFENSIKAALSEHGLILDQGIGSSGYKLDLAIQHPKNSSEYVLGIDCDGSQSKSSRYSRDKDKVRKAILEARGWKLHRIWSEDWLTNRNVEIEKIKQKVNELAQLPDKDG